MQIDLFLPTKLVVASKDAILALTGQTGPPPPAKEPAAAEEP
jgi:hypothetical protein